jgi:hypothetical protein
MYEMVEPISSNTFAKPYARLVRQDEWKMTILGIPQKKNPRISHNMGLSTNAGHSGRSRNSRGGGCGQGDCGRSASGTVPRKASEVDACKDIEGHIFTIGLRNKGKDGNMLRTSMEKMTTYIGTKYGNEAAQEWTSGKKTNLLEPA